ncbi:phage tail protein, partial [Kluyvera intermedia]
AECDARYVVDVQLGAGTSKTTWNASGNWPKTAGYVITSVWKDSMDQNLDGVVYAPLQKKIGSTWYTVSGGLA